MGGRPTIKPPNPRFESACRLFKKGWQMGAFCASREDRRRWSTRRLLTLLKRAACRAPARGRDLTLVTAWHTLSYSEIQSMTRERDTKAPFSARFSRSTLVRLRERATRAGTAQTALAERYIEEGVRMDEHPLIYFREGASGRRPALMGTRLDVWQVIETVRQNSNSVANAASYLRLPVSHVEACAAYYIAYQAEVDEWTDREHQAAEEAEISWRRRQEIFT